MTTQTNTAQGGPQPYTNPYLAGVLLGGAPGFIRDPRRRTGGFGRHRAYRRLLSLTVSASHTLGSEYFGKWGASPLNYYLVFMFVGTFFGALFSALLANRVHIQVERGAASSVSRRLWHALAGGVIVGFASRLAQGCTSGQALERRRTASHRQPCVSGLPLRQRLCHSLVFQEAMA